MQQFFCLFRKSGFCNKDDGLHLTALCVYDRVCVCVCVCVCPAQKRLCISPPPPPLLLSLSPLFRSSCCCCWLFCCCNGHTSAAAASDARTFLSDANRSHGDIAHTPPPLLTSLQFCSLCDKRLDFQSGLRSRTLAQKRSSTLLLAPQEKMEFLVGTLPNSGPFFVRRGRRILRAFFPLACSASKEMNGLHMGCCLLKPKPLNS